MSNNNAIKISFTNYRFMLWVAIIFYVGFFPNRAIFLQYISLV